MALSADQRAKKKELSMEYSQRWVLERMQMKSKLAWLLVVLMPFFPVIYILGGNIATIYVNSCNDTVENGILSSLKHYHHWNTNVAPYLPSPLSPPLPLLPPSPPPPNPLPPTLLPSLPRPDQHTQSRPSPSRQYGDRIVPENGAGVRAISRVR